MRKLIAILSFFVICVTLQAQSYNQERVALSNFLTRMYMNQPFEGVKVVQDYENTYLLSVVLVTPTASESTTNRLAQVKSNRNVSQYIGGLTMISSETIIKTTENTKENGTYQEITETIKENSFGYTRSMEILNTIDLESGQRVYLFIRNIEEMKD